MSRITELEIDGVKYKFDFGVNGWCHIEKLAGMTSGEILKQLDGNVTLLCCVVQGALRRFHPDITLEQAGDIATAAGDKLGEAIEESQIGEARPAAVLRMKAT